MLVAYLFPILILIRNSDTKIVIEQQDDNSLVSCVSGIIEKYLYEKITYVDINYDSNEIIKIIHSLKVLAISRNTKQKLRNTNFQYVIAVGKCNDFTVNFPNLLKEPFWNPYARFLIIVKSLEYADLMGIFDTLLIYHAVDVVVLNGTSEANLYTYNPFDNYNCGKKYDGIIEYGKCLESDVDNFYPYKIVTGLKKCIFNVTISHWPPFAIDQSIKNDSTLGSEQYALKIISELEQFELKQTKSISGEDFSTISANMSATGDLYMLQTRQTDIVFGGMILIYSRSLAFNYICGHLPFMDDVRVLVRKAGSVPPWKYLFLEFDTTVWLFLIICFICYFTVVVAILRVKDKTALLLVMIDLFFLHGSKILFQFKRVFIMWVLFAYLISTYYQSSLFSIMSHPIKDYQISTEKDLNKFKMEPCISTGLQLYIGEVLSESIEIKYQDGCNKMIESITTVAQSDKKYALSLSSIYLYNRHKFYDQYGEDPIYVFKHPVNSIIYAYYLYKGFPLHDKLNAYTMKLRENGMIDRYTHNLYEERLRKYLRGKTYTERKKTGLTFPWYILNVGYVAAIGLFIFELFSSRRTRSAMSLRKNVDTSSMLPLQ